MGGPMVDGRSELERRGSACRAGAARAVSLLPCRGYLGPVGRVRGVVAGRQVMWAKGVGKLSVLIQPGDDFRAGSARQGGWQTSLRVRLTAGTGTGRHAPLGNIKL